MARRVMLDVNGLRVSQPGQDADTASPINLQFDSAWCYPGAFLRGSRYFSTAEFHAGSTIDILYGRTFSTPPMCFVGIYQTWNYNSANYTGIEWQQGLDSAYFFSQVFRPSGSLYTTRAYGQIVTQTLADRLRCYLWGYHTSGYDVLPATLHYAIISYTR